MDIEELNGIIQIGELLAGKDPKIKNLTPESRVHFAMVIYSQLFNNLSISNNKLEALNTFTHYLKDFMKIRNINILSSYATLYALEPAFKDEYKQVSEEIEKIMKTNH